MAAKRPTKGKKPATGGKKTKRRKKKMRLTLKSRTMKEEDTYTDSVGWSTTGRVLEDAVAAPESDKIKHQCRLCGSIMMVAKPKRAKYTITCPNCEHKDDFS